MKNLLVLIIPFSDGKLIGNQFDVHSIYKSLLAFIAVSMMASFNYIVNDLRDIDSDKAHIQKKLRPIASGRINKFRIIFLLTFTLVSSLILTDNFLGINAAFLLLGFGLLQFGYTFIFKNIVGLDIVVIAGLFFLRAIFPYTYLDVDVSPWLTSTVLFAALSLISAKRHSEIQTYIGNSTRKVLGEYSAVALLQITVSFWTLTLFSYVSWLQMQEAKINLMIGIATIFPLTAIYIRLLPKLISTNAENPEKYIFEDKINLTLLMLVAIGYLLGKHYI